MPHPFDAVLIVSFGGPEKPADVVPFLENVLRGRRVPRERMLEVAEHYYQFDGVSPINAQVRELMELLRADLDRRGIELPLFWGNRNWHPLLADTLREMSHAGCRRVLGLVLAAYGSYSSCRQYLDNIAEARQAVGSDAPVVEKIRLFYNHPGFIKATAARLRIALDQLPSNRRSTARIAFTAHSIPISMAENCDYVAQLTETCRLVTESLGIGGDRWRLVYQSRSGRPQDPWLEPDICDHLATLPRQGVRDVVIAPIGFLSDHIEVLYDLDEQAAEAAAELGLTMVRAATVGVHPLFVEMLGDLLEERLTESPDRVAVGRFGPAPDVCSPACCPARIRGERSVR